MTAADLREYLQYDPNSGVLTWVKSPAICVPAGSVAGTPSTCGYLNVGFRRKTYFAHRLAWIIHYGEWPSKYVDHVNGDRVDNRISNLREATRLENNRNSKSRKNTSSIYKGVSWRKDSQKWQSYICLGENSIARLGLFAEESDAALAYNLMAVKHFGEFAKLNVAKCSAN